MGISKSINITCTIRIRTKWRSSFQAKKIFIIGKAVNGNILLKTIIYYHHLEETQELALSLKFMTTTNIIQKYHGKTEGNIQ